MPSHRSLRMAEAIREVVASAILFEVADPRVRAVTVLRVEVSPDLRHATVYVSVMGTEAERKLALTGLQARRRLLPVRVAARLQTRFTPILTFKLDDSVKKSVEIGRLIDEAVAVRSQARPVARRRRPRPTTDGRRRGLDRAKTPDDDAPPGRLRPEPRRSRASPTLPTGRRRAGTARLALDPNRIHRRSGPWRHKANRSS